MPTDPSATETYLSGLLTSDRARAAAFDAVHNAPDDTEAAARLKALPFSNDVRAELWDLRSGVAVPSRHQTTATTQEPAVPSSAGRRFVESAAAMLNPVTMAQGAYQAVRHPIDTLSALAQAQGEQFVKAQQNLRRGRLSEATGHLTAGVVPVIGPVAADIGEQIGAGDVAGGAGAATGLLAPLAAARPVAAAARRVAPALQRSAERRVVQALGPTKERFKAMAEARAPQILSRGLSGSRATLQAQASAEVAAVGEQIGTLLKQHGGQPVNPQPIVDALERAKSAYQTTRDVPLADAMTSGAAQTPGARVVGNMVEVPVVFEPRPIAQLTKLQRVITDLGPEARIDQLVEIRRAWDTVVADAGGFSHRAPGAVGQPLRDVSEAATKRKATTAIRQLLAAEVPSLSALNREFSFWKDLDDIVRQTQKRTQPHGPSLARQVRGTAGTTAGAVVGAAAGGAFGGGAGALLGGGLATIADAAFTSPRWRLVSARTRHALADALVSRNPERIGAVLGKASAVTGGGSAVTAAVTAAQRQESPVPTRAQRE